MEKELLPNVVYVSKDKAPTSMAVYDFDSDAGHGSCHEVWSLKRKYLAEHGIDRSSLALLNPGFHFD
ncbi:MAG: hypothetical protein E7644_03355 [Ruminococcaceae bacterium]|nr:hypothetical protein [Oscillospiraceae bacterium]